MTYWVARHWLRDGYILQQLLLSIKRIRVRFIEPTLFPPFFFLRTNVPFFFLSGKPDSPHNCTVVNLTQSWLFIKCVRGFDGGLPQDFICEVVQEWNDKVISNVTSKMEPEFRLTGLEAKTTYNIVIYATNIKGRSKEKAVLRVQTLPNVTLQSRQIVGS